MAEPLDRDAIRARADAATQGPWRAWDRGVGWQIQVGDGLDEYGRPARLVPEGHRTDIGREEDAQFIAHAREDVPALLAELDGMDELFERAEVERDFLLAQADDDTRARFFHERRKEASHRAATTTTGGTDGA